MNFAVLPPEVNSARIFAGAGLGPMLAAAVAAKRRHLYYVRPLDGHPVARVDRKTDRAADSLPVAGVLGELDIPPVTVAEGLAGELASMASWLGLGGIAVSTRGDLAGELCAATKRTNG